MRDAWRIARRASSSRRSVARGRPLLAWARSSSPNGGLEFGVPPVFYTPGIAGVLQPSMPAKSNDCKKRRQCSCLSSPPFGHRCRSNLPKAVHEPYNSRGSSPETGDSCSHRAQWRRRGKSEFCADADRQRRERERKKSGGSSGLVARGRQFMPETGNSLDPSGCGRKVRVQLAST